tara:strand:+ start:4565 stop:5110 length:546 start_codon:yes stop_codon:yes gene_type:complete
MQEGEGGINQNMLQSLRESSRLTTEAECGTQCSICLENFTNESNVINLDCNHLFHRDCIIQWFRRHSTCPVCRHSQNNEETQTTEMSVELNPNFYSIIFNQIYSFNLVYPNGTNLPTYWFGYNTIIDIMQFIQHSMQNQTPKIQIKIDQCSFKTTESYIELNKSLAFLNLSRNTNIEISVF